MSDELPPTTSDNLSRDQARERKKPRKLERRSVQIEELTPITPIDTLDTRVSDLENQLQNLTTRVTQIETRPTTSRRTYTASRRTSSRSTARGHTAASASAQRPSTNSPSTQRQPRPSLADQLRQSHQRRTTLSSDAIEEIPRTALTTTDKQVALTGNYAIPLPAHLTTADIITLKSGLTAAGTIARTLLGTTLSPDSRGSGSVVTDAEVREGAFRASPSSEDLPGSGNRGPEGAWSWLFWSGGLVG